MQKTAKKKIKNSRNETILKIDHQAKAIAHAESSLGVKNWNSKKHTKFILQIIYSCSVQKTTRKKTQMVEKWDHFKNRPSCKGYSPCKIFILGEKLKFQKTWQNPFYKSFTVVLCKKTARKKTKYSRNEIIVKIGHHAKAIAHAKSSFWVKN